MTLVGETIQLPGDYDASRTTVTVGLARRDGSQLPYGYGPSNTLISSKTVELDENSAWELDLVANWDIEPADTLYRVIVTRRRRGGVIEKSRRLFHVPDTGGPYTPQFLDAAYYGGYFMLGGYGGGYG